MEYNYNFPEATKTDGFRYGTKTIDSDTTAKHLLYSGVGMVEQPCNQKMYEKTHGATRPG